MNFLLKCAMVLAAMVPLHHVAAQSPQRFLDRHLRRCPACLDRMTEFAILLSARSLNSRWAWRSHYKAAIKAGLDPKVGTELAAGKKPAGMQADEAALYDLATEIFRDKKVSDTTYAAALAQFGENGIVELIGLMGYYNLVGMLLIAGNAVPPDGPEVPTLQPLARD